MRLTATNHRTEDMIATLSILHVPLRGTCIWGGVINRALILIILLLLPCTLSAQRQKERRVYYIDCSYSMKTNGIWDEVRGNLKKAIEAIKDETTEVLVVPFAFDTQHHTKLNGEHSLATSGGKAHLIKYIDKLPMQKATLTFHSDPIRDFYKHRVLDNGVTYMFLMTDGQNEEKPRNAFQQEIEKWNSKYKGRNVYGFYVMLNPQARNDAVESAIESQDNFWSVQTADVNINFIRLDDRATYNARNDKYFDVPIRSGNVNGKCLNAQFTTDSTLLVTRAEVTGNKLRVHTKLADGIDVYSLPSEQECQLNIKISGKGMLDILGTERVAVKCLSKPERSLKITIR